MFYRYVVNDIDFPEETVIGFTNSFKPFIQRRVRDRIKRYFNGKYPTGYEIQFKVFKEESDYDEV